MAHLPINLLSKDLYYVETVAALRVEDLSDGQCDPTKRKSSEAEHISKRSQCSDVELRHS